MRAHPRRRILGRMSEVAALEDVCERAWPPRERIELDGAVLRFTDGFTRRANSARVDGGGDGSRRPPGAGRARVPQPRPASGIPPDAALAAGVRAAARRAWIRRRHRGGRDGGGDAARCRRADGAARRSRSRPALDEEWLQAFKAVERNWPAEQDPGARWVLGSGESPRRFARRAPRRCRRRDRVRTTRGRLALHRVRRNGARAPPSGAGARDQRAPPRAGAPPPAHGEPSCRSRRKTRRRRGFMRSSASARATSTATSCRVRSRSLTNTPFWASQGPGG